MLSVLNVYNFFRYEILCLNILSNKCNLFKVTLIWGKTCLDYFDILIYFAILFTEEKFFFSGSGWGAS